MLFALTESAVDPLPVGVAGTFVIAGARAVAGAVVRARGRGDADESESYEKTHRHRRVRSCDVLTESYDKRNGF